MLDFYPSIKETLLRKVISFAEKRVSITNEDKVIIKNARKSLKAEICFDDRRPCIESPKKCPMIPLTRNPLFHNGNLSCDCTRKFSEMMKDEMFCRRFYMLAVHFFYLR